MDEHRLVRDEEEALVERVEEALDGLHRAADALALVVEGAAVEAARLDLLHLLLGERREDLGEEVRARVRVRARARVRARVRVRVELPWRRGEGYG